VTYRGRQFARLTLTDEKISRVFCNGVNRGAVRSGRRPWLQGGNATHWLRGSGSLVVGGRLSLGYVGHVAAVSDASIHRNIGSISIYRIVSYRRRKYRNFRRRYRFLVVLPNFHVRSPEVVKFSLKLSLNFSSWENLVQFYITLLPACQNFRKQ